MKVPNVTHEPPGYQCPFCAAAKGTAPEFEAWRDDLVMVLITTHWYPRNPGHALVVPLAHHENVYVLPDSIAARIATVARRVAVAMRTTYPCDGVTIRQNNEPAGNQDVWYVHTHVIPRHTGDRLYGAPAARVDHATRAPYASRLREGLAQIGDEARGTDVPSRARRSITAAERSP